MIAWAIHLVSLSPCPLVAYSVVEIKWQNQPARRADLEHFLTRVQAAQANLPQPPDVLWFIARAGFREAALRFARQKNILVSSEQDLQMLAERLGVRFAK